MGGIHRWRMVRGMVEPYRTDFLVLVCGINRLIPEVNLSQKLNNKIIIYSKITGRKMQDIVCFLGKGTHITRDICFPSRGTNITRHVCLTGRGTHITRDMCFPSRGTHITRVLCFPGSGTHISQWMCAS